MARFSIGGAKTFSARTQVFPGRGGARIGLVTPGISRTKFRKAAIRKIPRKAPLNLMVKP